MAESMTNDGISTPLAMLRKQRSHVLLVLSNAKTGHEAAFLDWYLGAYREAVSRIPSVLCVQHYQQDEVDITQGRFAPLPFRYLGWYELSVDGAHAAESIIERIGLLHRQQAVAVAPATWLYYPVSEKVGRSPPAFPSMMTLAFANAVPGQESVFREWYATRHIRHALNVNGFISGQCFERALFQRPGALPASFNTIAVYEQEVTAESILRSFLSVPDEMLDFPTLDLSRFVEWVYRPL